MDSFEYDFVLSSSEEEVSIEVSIDVSRVLYQGIEHVSIILIEKCSVLKSRL
jgi:hypothetical protein